MLDAISIAQTEYLLEKSEASRKELGQYFTGSAIAKFMASLVIHSSSQEQIKILDAGGGFGILAIAASLKCLEIGIKKIHVVIYEIDVELLAHLERNLKEVKTVFAEDQASFSYEIFAQDFVLTRPDLFDNNFDLAIINPPYFKYNSKNSPYADATSDLFKGNPNIYASFMGVASASLKPNGQMIAIVPRSFTNGLYFKGFRHYLNKNLNLNRLHIFHSRNQLFKELAVLQENIICSYIKTHQQEQIHVSASEGYDDFDHLNFERYSSKMIIDQSNDQEIIRIPEDREDAKVIEFIENLESNFEKNQYFISTGPVVEHRTQEYIGYEELIPTVPLWRMHNIKCLEAIWTGNHKKDEYFKLKEGSEKHLTLNKSYFLLKRFSSKDEKRRLVGGVYIPSDNSPYLALENHVNYVGHKIDNLSKSEAFGLAVFFNSTLLDRYFRCISGNTQVNATEIRLIKMPSRHLIEQLGESFLELNQLNPSQEIIDKIISDILKA
ncbi:methyltransferase [Acinetobacter oleivorans]|uniref:Eco57I restriction-modification methylase domain-containing protein n=1 Tax=Acinetobacter oleivorans TaxID=1148157 RepID=UPI000D30820D|nr:Eco57I restriction-modification methylase domain-containing protein [Acinetobacter oleivorans]PTV44562.1 methyltransferase [Acinetobacter oleivorans]